MMTTKKRSLSLNPKKMIMIIQKATWFKFLKEKKTPGRKGENPFLYWCNGFLVCLFHKEKECYVLGLDGPFTLTRIIRELNYLEIGTNSRPSVDGEKLLVINNY